VPDADALSFRSVLWYCFGVGFANFGTAPAPSAAALRSTGHDARIEFVASYRATGNYLVRAPRNAARLLQRELDRLTQSHNRWAVVPERRVEDAVRAFDSWGPPSPERLVRFTPGLAFAVERGTGARLTRSERGTFRSVSEDVIAVYKRDLEIRLGVLDKNRRLGGWGAISLDIHRRVGGRWTARSLGAINGLAAKATR
jgi:hypothetical protein